MEWGGGGISEADLWTLHYVPIVSRFVQNTTALAGPVSSHMKRTTGRSVCAWGWGGGACSVLMGIISFYLRQLSLPLILI